MDQIIALKRAPSMALVNSRKGASQSVFSPLQTLIQHLFLPKPFRRRGRQRYVLMASPEEHGQGQSDLYPLSSQLNQRGLVIGNRIPRDYFVTKGSGESDITVHAGSYHLALKSAGIERYNIMTYSSILPAIATEVPQQGAMIHGSVMETIMAVAHAKKGQRATAGIIYGWLYDKQTGEKYGGLVCEHNGTISEQEVQRRLNASLQELYTNGFSETYELRDITLKTESFFVRKKYGTALVALCFTNYLYPVL
ncbi:pyruvoyl-dependent arginine decarboxylase [Candidatus Woesearchaeota archaeon]|nr:pyruvoyl-dependent arginine decarboxylase [Candidatus Woesearchaeota archaeon]